METFGTFNTWGAADPRLFVLPRIFLSISEVDGPGLDVAINFCLPVDLAQGQEGIDFSMLLNNACAAFLFRQGPRPRSTYYLELISNHS